MSNVNRRTLIQTGAAAALGAAVTTSPSPTSSATRRRPKPGSLRVLSWNIYEGGRGERVGGKDNLPALLDQLVDISPDVFLCVETYGSGPDIENALTKRAGKGTYKGIRITTDRPTGEDNLWIFTHLPIVKVLPKPAGGEVVSDFNLGGVRVRLDNGRAADFFVMWINYTDPWDGYLVDENAAGLRAGVEPRNSVDDVLRAGRRQTRYVREILERHLPAMRGGYDGPMVIGGDCNTLPAQDWSDKWADCPNKLGMTYAFTASKAFTDTGYVDTFREVHPDACVVEGRTWTPLPDERLITPQRIDMIYAMGKVKTIDAATIDTRMPQHGAGIFYSDHAAVTADITIR